MVQTKMNKSKIPKIRIHDGRRYLYPKSCAWCGKIIFCPQGLGPEFCNDPICEKQKSKKRVFGMSGTVRNFDMYPFIPNGFFSGLDRLLSDKKATTIKNYIARHSHKPIPLSLSLTISEAFQYVMDLQKLLMQHPFFSVKESCCVTLKKHHDLMINDPERLSTEFIKKISKCECDD